ncbi:transposase [uncultured Rubinisphaera sp.]|uniref:REP-associated tyrosine transposase n=1 Tax=uncultured Rubinisphaera sp. TaxID=1678686 RepID=UPI0030D9B0EA|tara:strand:+ start:8901 stop:9422 length:522 start_codon:yes stop_codon:yes gene_type:complete
MVTNRRIVDDQLYVHFVTFSVDKRRKLLDHDHPKRILLGVMNDLREKRSAKCPGFVIMPDHVHALLWFPTPGQLSSFLHEWKRQTSLRIRKWYRENASGYQSRYPDPVRFWQPKYYSFEIYSRKKLEEKLIYMHLNPVRNELVEKAVDWKWSSARWYEQQRSVGIPIDWVECD